MSATYLTDSFFYLVLAVNVSLICLLLITKIRKLQAQLLSLQASHRDEFSRGNKNIHGILGRLNLLEQQIEESLQKQGQLSANKTVDTNFSQASKLLDLGVDSEQLAHGFGLSEAEANLISLIHEKQEAFKQQKILEEVA